MVSIGTYIITILVALIAIVSVYFIGENRGKAKVAWERAQLDAYRKQLKGYLDHFGDRVSEETNEHFKKFLNLLKAKLGGLL